MEFDPVHQIQQHDEEQAYGAGLAVQACSACKKQKRKCDKTLPACSLCQRIGRPCDYHPDSQPPAPSPEAFALLQQQVANLEQLLRAGINNPSPPDQTNSHDSSNGSFTISDDTLSKSGNALLSDDPPTWCGPNTFPVLYFLDSNAFQYAKFQIQAPYVRVPPGALAALGNSQELRGMIEHFFATVHTYLPIVSKIRLYQHMSNPAHEPGSDIALLFLAMKLACSEVPEGMPATTRLYQDVKSFYHYVESQNGFSIQMIQALLLIALYEMGHAIYPAAYLSIGNAARVGHASGLHAKDAPQMLARSTTWTEQEERRRVWWGIIILDRFINLGHRGKPFATNDPGLQAHLPTNDEAWDRGEMLVTAPLALSASETIRAAPFARTCQSAHLLGKAIRHIDDKAIPWDYRFQEGLQISRTLKALADVIPSDHDEGEPSMAPRACTSMAICYSTLLTLYDAYSCTEAIHEDMSEDHLLMQQDSIDGLKEYSERVLQLARRVKAIIERQGTAGLSPMIIDAVYQSAATQAWYVKETSQACHGEKLEELREVLSMLDRRWRVAGQYLGMINDFTSWELHH